MAWRVEQHGRKALFAVLAAGLPGLGGCGSMASDSSLSAAQVRFVEVSPGAPEMDFYVNGVGAAYGIGFESFTSYLPVTSGPATLAVSRKGLTQALVTAQGTLSGGRQYTAIVSHGLGSLQERIYPDQDTPASAGQIAVRVMNEAEALSGLVVYLTPLQGSASPAVLNLASGAASGYVTLPAGGSFAVTATVTDRNLNVPVSTVTIKAVSGTVHTVVFGGVGRSGVVGFALTDVEGQP